MNSIYQTFFYVCVVLREFSFRNPTDWKFQMKRKKKEFFIVSLFWFLLLLFFRFHWIWFQSCKIQSMIEKMKYLHLHSRRVRQCCWYSQWISFVCSVSHYHQYTFPVGACDLLIKPHEEQIGREKERNIVKYLSELFKDYWRNNSIANAVRQKHSNVLIKLSLLRMRFAQ